MSQETCRLIANPHRLAGVPGKENGILTFDGKGPDDPVALPASEHEPRRPVTIMVCSSCRDATGSDARPRPGEQLADDARRHLDEDSVRIVPVECLGNCKRRLSAAFVMDGAWSYVFGDLAVDNGGDLVAAARLFQTSSDGLLPWRGRPDCLKRGLVSRIPPISSLKGEE